MGLSPCLTWTFCKVDPAACKSIWSHGTAPRLQKNLLILWACEALKVMHRLPTWPKTSRMNKLHKLRQPAQIVSANWILLSACPRARAPRWMRRTTEADLRIHHGTLLNLCNFSSSKFWSPFSLPHLDFLQSRSRRLQVHLVSWYSSKHAEESPHIVGV